MVAADGNALAFDYGDQAVVTLRRADDVLARGGSLTEARDLASLARARATLAQQAARAKVAEAAAQAERQRVELAARVREAQLQAEASRQQAAAAQQQANAALRQAESAQQQAALVQQQALAAEAGLRALQEQLLDLGPKSERRALAVQSALAALGIDARRIIVRGYGPAYPIASNDTCRPADEPPRRDRDFRQGLCDTGRLTSESRAARAGRASIASDGRARRRCRAFSRRARLRTDRHCRPARSGEYDSSLLFLEPAMLEPSSSFARSAGLAALALMFGCAMPSLATAQAVYFDVVRGSVPHDVAASPQRDGPVFYVGQRNGTLGILDPSTGKVEEVRLGSGSAPHGVIVGPDGAPWITDGGLNAIVRVDPKTRAVRSWPLPDEAGGANLNTATFDRKGRIWFTGQSGWYGRLDPASNDMKVWRSPRGSGPYGITTTPAGDVYYVSLAGNHLARVDVETGEATVIEPLTPRQGARRAWSDSKGRIWISYWNTGQVGMYDPATKAWKEWKLPGERPQAYSVWVDDRDQVWLSEWSTNAIVRFDPSSERFTSYPSDRDGARVRQMLGRSGEAWGAESGTDRLVRIRPAS